MCEFRLEPEPNTGPDRDCDAWRRADSAAVVVRGGRTRLFCCGDGHVCRVSECNRGLMMGDREGASGSNEAREVVEEEEEKQGGLPLTGLKYDRVNVVG